MDAFYASVEQRDAPELRGKPVIVAGSEQGRGVVAAASYEARQFGVRSAMPTRTALRLCPEAIRVPPRHEHYAQVSRQIRSIFLSYTPLVEPLALDECYLDLTEYCQRKGERLAVVAQAIKADLARAVDLTSSAGGAPCKFVAKVASDLRKPLRASSDDALLAAAIDRAIELKPKGHDFIIDRRHNRPSVSRHMSVTGG